MFFLASLLRQSLSLVHLLLQEFESVANALLYLHLAQVSINLKSEFYFNMYFEKFGIFNHFFVLILSVSCQLF